MLPADGAGIAAICPAFWTTAASRADGSRHLRLILTAGLDPAPDPVPEAPGAVIDDARELISVLMLLSSSESSKKPSHEPSATGVRSGVMVRLRDIASALSRLSGGDDKDSSPPSLAVASPSFGLPFAGEVFGWAGGRDVAAMFAVPAPPAEEAFSSPSPSFPSPTVRGKPPPEDEDPGELAGEMTALGLVGHMRGPGEDSVGESVPTTPTTLTFATPGEEPRGGLSAGGCFLEGDRTGDSDREDDAPRAPPPAMPAPLSRSRLPSPEGDGGRGLPRGEEPPAFPFLGSGGMGDAPPLLPASHRPASPSPEPVSTAPDAAPILGAGCTGDRALVRGDERSSLEKVARDMASDIFEALLVSWHPFETDPGGRANMFLPAGRGDLLLPAPPPPGVEGGELVSVAITPPLGTSPPGEGGADSSSTTARVDTLRTPPTLSSAPLAP